MTPGCGACNLCCKLLAVPDISKPALMMCWHTGIHGGCGVQHLKNDPLHPEMMACSQWECMWLESQRNPDLSKRLSRNLRPDICGFVLGPRDREETRCLHVNVDPLRSKSWTEGEGNQYLNGLVKNNVTLKIVIGEHEFRVEGESP